MKRSGMAIGQAVLLLGCLGGVSGSFNRAAAPQAQLRPAQKMLNKAPSETGNSLRGVVANATALQAVSGHKKEMPCQCQAAATTWKATARTTPKCIFIDLGAADGNTFRAFMDGTYGPLSNCPSGGKWEATLVEANPRFDAPLKKTEGTYPGKVQAKSSHAAYMCEAQTTFYLDTQSHANNYWGSSMSENHVDTKRSGLTKVTVPTVNIIKLLTETTIPGDYVILKMDIEGAEWDILPCLAQAQAASLVDRLLVEVHPKEWGNAGTTQGDMDVAMATLRSKGVEIPAYNSQTL